MTQPKILVVGDVMLDHYFHGTANRLSPEAPVPVVHVGKQEPRLGGASNVALNLARLGAEVTLCGTVGRDHAGGIIRRIAESAGIRTAFVEGRARSIEKIRVLAQSQQIVRLNTPATEVAGFFPANSAQADTSPTSLLDQPNFHSAASMLPI